MLAPIKPDNVVKPSLSKYGREFPHHCSLPMRAFVKW
jgi:hypothetical protein